MRCPPGERFGSTTPYRRSHTRNTSGVSPVRSETTPIGCRASVTGAMSGTSAFVEVVSRYTLGHFLDIDDLKGYDTWTMHGHNEGIFHCPPGVGSASPRDSFPILRRCAESRTAHAA